MLKKINYKFAIRLLISIVMLVWFLVSMNWQQLGQVLQNARYTGILAAILFVILAVIISVFKWNLILKAQGIKLDLRELWNTYWVGLFFNNFLPSSIGGDALRIVRTGKACGDIPGAATSVVVERLLATTGLAMVGLLGCLLIQKPRLEIFLLFALLVVISIALVAMLMWGRLPAKLEAKQNKITLYITGFMSNGNRIRREPWVVLNVVFWSMIFQLCVVAVNFFIFSSLNINHISWVDLIYVIPTTSIASMLPLGINGYGVREGAYITLLSAYGVPQTAAFAASITFAFLVSLCSLWGGWIWVRSRKVLLEVNT